MLFSKEIKLLLSTLCVIPFFYIISQTSDLKDYVLRSCFYFKCQSEQYHKMVVLFEYLHMYCLLFCLFLILLHLYRRCILSAPTLPLLIHHGQEMSFVRPQIVFSLGLKSIIHPQSPPTHLQDYSAWNSASRLKLPRRCHPNERCVKETQSYLCMGSSSQKPLSNRA